MVWIDALEPSCFAASCLAGLASKVCPAKEETLDAQTMLSAVEDYVLRERERRGIKSVDTSFKPEFSGFAFNEFVMLLERQLMTTTIGFGGWEELSDIKILEGVYRLVESRSSEHSN